MSQEGHLQCHNMPIHITEIPKDLQNLVPNQTRTFKTFAEGNMHVMRCHMIIGEVSRMYILKLFKSHSTELASQKSCFQFIVSGQLACNFTQDDRLMCPEKPAYITENFKFWMWRPKNLPSTPAMSFQWNAWSQEFTPLPWVLKSFT